MAQKAPKRKPYEHQAFPCIMYRGGGEGEVQKERFETPEALDESDFSDWRDTPQVAKAAKAAPKKANGSKADPPATGAGNL